RRVLFRSDLILRYAIDPDLGRDVVLAYRVWLEPDPLKEAFVDHLVGGFDHLGGCEIALPQLPCEFVHRRLPRDGADQESAIGVDIYRFEHVSTSWDEIAGKQKVLMKAVFLRVDEIDLVLISSVDDKHRVLDRIRGAKVVRARDG